MEDSYRFFANKKCKYYPCHKETAELNCLFCFCPLYNREHCPGNPKYITSNGKTVKSCENCTFAHKPENYDIIMRLLKEEQA